MCACFSPSEAKMRGIHCERDALPTELRPHPIHDLADDFIMNHDRGMARRFPGILESCAQRLALPLEWRLLAERSEYRRLSKASQMRSLEAA